MEKKKRNKAIIALFLVSGALYALLCFRGEKSHATQTLKNYYSEEVAPFKAEGE